MTTRETKPCVVCGRGIEWRKKWERDWPQVRYCSKACRGRGVSALDTALERALLDLLRARRGNATLCPSEAARAVAPDRWRDLMEPARRAARRLAVRGVVEITQRGRAVDPSAFRGPVRVRLAGANPTGSR